MQSVIDKIDNFWNEDGKSHSELAISYCKISRDGRQNIERQIHELGNRSAATKYHDQREEEDWATKATDRIELINRQRAISREIRKQLDELDAYTTTRKTSRASLKRGGKIFHCREISQRSPDIMAKEMKEDYLARWKRYNLKQKNKLQVLCQSYSHRKRHIMLRVFKVWRRFIAERKILSVKTRWIIEKCAPRELENYIYRWLKHTSMSCSIRRLELAQEKRHKSIVFEAWKRLVKSLAAIRKLQSKQRGLCKIFVFTEWCRITKLHRSIELFKNKTSCALLAIVWNKWLILRLQRKAIAAKIHDFILFECRRTCSTALRAWYALKNKSKSLQNLSRRAKYFTTLWALNAWMYAYHNRLQIKNDYLNMLGRFRKKLTQSAFERWRTYQSVAQQRAKRLYVFVKKQIARSACQELIVAAKESRDRRFQVASRKTRRFLWEWYDFSVKAVRTRALAQMMHHRQSRLLLKDTAWRPWKIALQLRQQSHKADQYLQTKVRKEAWKALRIALSQQIAIKRSCYFLTQLLERTYVSFGVATWSKFCYKSKEQRKVLKYADDIHIDSLIVKGFYRWEVFMKTEHERELIRIKTTRLFMRSSLRRWHHNSETKKFHLEKLSESIVHISNRNTLSRNGFIAGKIHVDNNKEYIYSNALDHIGFVKEFGTTGTNLSSDASPGLIWLTELVKR
uniref:AlNc14C1G89 protein n=1 Tax=Albugo laibachii Nc14 TaxID=890382 RepID=F0VYT8_9STRA|nr:AlNc14C1G89 [Albugo laibachii Nc14]|eukprot:CCA13953.1 AlNc14C1G89 [Albugo laibachii Nc14]